MRMQRRMRRWRPQARRRMRRRRRRRRTTTTKARAFATVARTAARTRMQDGLKARGVPSAIYYPKPLHRQPAYRDAHDGAALPVSEDLAERIMALPIHPDLSEADLARICDAVLANV